MGAPTGGTRLAAVIGSPVRHSLSPVLHNAAFEAAGLDWVYVALEVAEGRVPEALAGIFACTGPVEGPPAMHGGIAGEVQRDAAFFAAAAGEVEVNEAEFGHGSGFFKDACGLVGSCALSASARQAGPR